MAGSSAVSLPPRAVQLAHVSVLLSTAQDYSVTEIHRNLQGNGVFRDILVTDLSIAWTT